MFKSFRWRIAMWIVGLSSINYLILCVVGALYFYTTLSKSIDEELKVVASQIGHAIDLTANKPTFRDWLRVVETEPARSIISMQLFDKAGNLLEHYGPQGIPQLCLGQFEADKNGVKYRLRQSKLMHKAELVGFLQLELPTEERDSLTREFLMTMMVMAPIVLLGFGLCSYIVSGIATGPIEELVATLRRFVADAGHELNTPTSIVAARAQSLDRKLKKTGMVSNDLEIISATTNRMSAIIQNLMLLAEVDSTTRSISKYTRLNLKDLIDTITKEYTVRFEQKNITFNAECEDSVIFSNSFFIESIVRNLLENALRYTEAGSVTLRCFKLKNEISLTVADTGIGIPSEQLSKVFDRFFRVDHSRSRASGGSGLGLSIVKSFVEKLGGRVEVKSEAGRGTTFIVRLPIAKMSGRAETALPQSKNSVNT